ncbi:tetratricopeptide repeat protein [Niabella soli]|uniref:Uncharacterized protein n=1 Tax=Niabella soli DSM 19437 TaxID=929713 RepID=W0F4K9_9BACT|nr:hypothetical protein [Niabella soli]AHF18010.1 hypothetical protein NIASO_18645 [Niabella soli DSM 19437]
MKLHAIFILLIIILFDIYCPGQTSYDRSKLQRFYQDLDNEQALAYLKSIPPNTDAEYLFDLGYANYINGQTKEAGAIFTALYHKDRALPVPQLYLAMLFEQQRNYDSALFYYKNLTLLLPNSYKYWLAGARQWSRLNQTDSAVSYAQKSYRLSPASGRVVYDLAAYLKVQKRKTEAEKLIDLFLKQDTTYDPVIGQKITLCFDAKRYKEAIQWGELYRRREADAPLPYISLLYSYLNTNNPDSVISLYKWLGLKNMMAESIAYGAALAYATRKNYKASDSLLSECLKLNIQETAVTYLRAMSNNATALKNYKQAVAFYDTAYYLFHDPIDLFFAGKVYDKHLHDPAKAAVYYQKFRVVCPRPSDPDEVAITQYIKEFLPPRKR